MTRRLTRLVASGPPAGHSWPATDPAGASWSFRGRQPVTPGRQRTPVTALATLGQHPCTSVPTPRTPHMPQLPKAYDPAAVESALYEDWRAAGLFHADPDDDGEPFSIVIPPPNVTGSLHVGHALDNTIQDVIIRRARMQGRNAVWIPGHRPRRDRHPERRGEAARGRGHRPSRARPRGLPRAGVGLQGDLRWSDPEPAREARSLRRLGPRGVHLRRSAFRGRARGVRRPLRAGPDLPWQPPDQLVHPLPHRTVGHRGGARGRDRRAGPVRLPTRRRERRPRRCPRRRRG
jgi:hypothetical protein